MAVYWTLALVLFAGTTCLARPERIVGGEVTSIEKYPTIVQIDFYPWFSPSWDQSCAGTILNNWYFVSAAHCFSGFTYNGVSSRRIRAGATDRNVGGVIIGISAVNNHPSYGKNGLDGDITVVRLSNSLPYSSLIQPATIFVQDGVVPDNSPVVHAGWGTTSSQGRPSSQLRDVTIYTVNTELCKERYTTPPANGIITDNMICAGILDVGGKDACQGDSGGPLYYGNVLVGIVSWGRGCAEAFWPGVSARVSSYTNWIAATAV